MNRKENEFRPDVSMGTAIKRALMRKCPSCGEGRLFQGYLRQADHCSKCNEPLGEVRADDGPPWLTILIVGHLLAPVLVLVTGQSLVPLWLTGVGMMTLAMAMCLSILPMAKSVFIAVIWKSTAGDDATRISHERPTDQ